MLLRAQRSNLHACNAEIASSVALPRNDISLTSLPLPICDGQEQIIMERFGEKLRTLRQQRGLTAREKNGFTYNHWCKLKRIPKFISASKINFGVLKLTPTLKPPSNNANAGKLLDLASLKKVKKNEKVYFCRFSFCRFSYR